MISEQQLDSIFAPLTADHVFSDSVLVAEKNVIILKQRYGLADDSMDMPITADTVFDIGSISKKITATALLHLEAHRLLDVSDPIKSDLKEIPEDKEGITMHDLMTHTAGFTNEHADDFSPLSGGEALQTIYELKPGEEYRYPNFGYLLLTVFIEQRMGMAFTEFLKQIFLLLLRIIFTGFHNDDWAGKPVANCDFNHPDQARLSQWLGLDWGLMGNGGILWTVGDRYLWWRTLLGSNILPSALKKKLFTRHVEEFPRIHCGWTLQETAFGDIITHSGGGMGGKFDFAFYQNHGISMIILGHRITIRVGDDAKPKEISLPATNARLKFASDLFT